MLCCILVLFSQNGCCYFLVTLLSSLPLALLYHQIWCQDQFPNLFLISCLWLPLMGGGYSVIIPRKQTCSPRLKRSLCKWACRCPALSFSVDCISHLPRLTGSFRFPGSTRLQRFAPLWIPSPDWWQGSRVRRTLNVWGECLCRFLIPGVGAILFPIPEK